MNFCVAILILKREGKKQHFWHIMLYYFKKGKKATEMQNKIHAVYGEGAMTEQTCQKWFAKFRAWDFSLDDAPWSGRPVEVDSDQIETLIENNQRYTTREIADILKISKPSVENHLHQLGYVNRFDVWIPHKLSEKNLLDCISTCDSLLTRNENIPFSKQIVMGDEKWILYNNVELYFPQQWCVTTHTEYSLGSSLRPWYPGFLLGVGYAGTADCMHGWPSVSSPSRDQVHIV